MTIYLVFRDMPEDLDKSVVEDGFGAPVGGHGLLMRGEGYDGRVHFAVIAYLKDNKNKLIKGPFLLDLP